MKKIVSFFIVLALFLGTISGCQKNNTVDVSSATEDTSTVIESEISSETSSVASAPSSSSKITSSKTATSSTVKTTVKTKVPNAEPAPSWSHAGVPHNGNVDIDDNIFMDALGYTGYNLAKHRADGMMWKYVLSANKRNTGWLSGISFGGGSTGLETKNGKPDIAAFKRGGLVCASFTSYVYFNYLPNVAGIDTSYLTRPAKTYLAPCWYAACKDWVKKGYSRQIEFQASGSIKTFMKFVEKEEIPIGSIICFHDAEKPNSKECSHVCIYAGYKNGYHWVYQTGNKNGPEFCAIERFLFGPDPQMMLAVFTCPLSENIVNKSAQKNTTGTSSEVLK